MVVLLAVVESKYLEIEGNECVQFRSNCNHQDLQVCIDDNGLPLVAHTCVTVAIAMIQYSFRGWLGIWSRRKGSKVSASPLLEKTG